MVLRGRMSKRERRRRAKKKTGREGKDAVLSWEGFIKSKECDI